MYTFEFKEKSDTVYIKSAILNIPREISEEAIPAAVNEIMPFADDSAWFTIADIKVSEGDYFGEGFYQVTLSLDPHSEILPLFPKLITGDKPMLGISVLSFDGADDSFVSGEFIFYVEANSVEEVDDLLAHANLSIKDALFRVEADPETEIIEIKLDR